MKPDGDLREMLEALKVDYRSSLPPKVREIEVAGTALADGSADAGCLAALERVLHSIAGSAGTFGMESLGAAAAAAESLVEPYAARGAVPEAGDRARLVELLDAVRKEAG